MSVKILKLLMGIMAYLLALPGLAQANVRITNAANITMGTWEFTSLSGNDALCVYRSNSNVNYTVNVTDNSTLTPSGFYLQDTSTQSRQIPMTLSWGQTSAPGTMPLGDGVTIPATGAHIVRQNCDGGTTANVKVDVANSAMAAVPAGTYRSTITIVIGE